MFDNNNIIKIIFFDRFFEHNDCIVIQCEIRNQFN